MRGPNVTPGYWGRPRLTRAAFDEEGFYRIGDAARLADPHDPAKGIVFDGRVAEDFKLSTGTWVHVGGAARAAHRGGGAACCRTPSSPGTTATESGCSPCRTSPRSSDRRRPAARTRRPS